MKYRLILSFLALSFFMASKSTAQADIGVRAGYNMTTLKYVGLAEFIPVEMKINDGFEAGIFAEFQLGEHFSVQPGLSYSERGFLIKQNIAVGLENLGINIPENPFFDIEDIPINVKGRLDLNYLTLPVLGKLKFGNELVSIYFNAGPQVSYAINADLGVEGRIGIPFNFKGINIPLNGNFFEKFEAGAVVGAGLEFGLEKGKFLLDTRYVFGLTDLFNVSLVNANVRNRGLSLNVGYAYTL